MIIARGTGYSVRIQSQTRTGSVLGVWHIRFNVNVNSLITGSAAILYTLSGLAVGDVTGQARVYQIVERTVIWFQNIMNGQPGSDTLVFVLLLAILIWILSFNATWVYFRENRKWQAVLPTGLAMLVNLYYAPVNLKAYFVLYLIIAMLLLIRSTLAEREQQWYSEKIYFPFDIGFDVMRDGVLFVLFVVAVSWVLPTALSDNNQDVLISVEQAATELAALVGQTRPEVLAKLIGTGKYSQVAKDQYPYLNLGPFDSSMT